MRRAAPLVALALAAAGAVAPAAAATEEVVAALSRNRVALTTTFSGLELFVFGAIKRVAPPVDADFDVIVAVEGPTRPVLVRRKARTLGVWANAQAVTIDEAPSFYAVASTGPLSEILSRTADLRHRIGIDTQVRGVDLDSEGEAREAFHEAVIRLRRRAGLYLEAAGGVEVTEGALFTARFALPANLVEGEYQARVFLLHDGEVADVYVDSIAVSKEGLERWLYSLSREAPLIYGLLSIFVALAAGWAASETFRLLRR
ncbi:MAG: TIGR02186 family protein [Paracoccaceae bacterium]